MEKKRMFNPREIEARWQEKWKQMKLYQTEIREAKRPFYNLWMFPYPSGEGLHAGHAFASTGSDVYGRLKRMEGFNVFQPIGYDSFGIHSENYAIKIGSHPAKLIPQLRERYKKQLERMGHGYDWSRTVTTSDIDYYKWTQWLFVKMWQAGLVERKKARVNWCSSCKTVLADEQVINGNCERCESQVVQKDLEQWFFKMATGKRPTGELYVDSLLSNIEGLDWSEIIKTSQINWIGKKDGARVKFLISNAKFLIETEVFTTRIDTLFGATFVVVAPEVAKKWLADGWEASEEVREYIEQALAKTEQTRKIDEREKTGVKTNLEALNPANGEKVPVYVADYVLMDIGTGAVMGVPAHDRRDFDFAKKYNLPIKTVVEGTGEVYEGEGKLVESGDYTGMQSTEARQKMMMDGLGEKKTHYHLRDWLISRQRYWGAPVPMIFCEKCGWQAVKEEDLPVELPELENFKPTGSGVAPLGQLPNFVKTTCPKCGGEGRRETDVCDTFLDSSWYFLRYPNVGINGQAFEPELIKKWLPVKRYIGGAEHANLHLLYSRFVTMALFDMGLLPFEEPFASFRAHGLLIKAGRKMSKSKGNVISPDALLERYGADTLRCYLMFIGPLTKSADFRDSGVAGMYRWLARVWEMFLDDEKESEKTSVKLAKRLNRAIKEITEGYERLKYNTVLASLMEVINLWKEEGEVMTKTEKEKFLQLLAPLAPHMTEELYQQLKGKEGESIHLSVWPKYDEALLVDDEVKIAVQINGKMRTVITMIRDMAMEQNEVERVVLADEKVKERVGEKVYKVIFVPGRLINLVVGE